MLLSATYTGHVLLLMLYNVVVRCCVKFDFDSQILSQQRRNILSRFPTLQSFDDLKTTLLLLRMRISNLVLSYCDRMLRPFDQGFKYIMCVGDLTSILTLPSKTLNLQHYQWVEGYIIL